MTTTIKDFCLANNIEWFPVAIEVKTIKGKPKKNCVILPTLHIKV